MTKNGWVKALFRELNTTAADGDSSEARHRERWQQQQYQQHRGRQASEPLESFRPSTSTRSTTLADDYDAQLSLLARQSLQLDKRPQDARRWRPQSESWLHGGTKERQNSHHDDVQQNRLSFPSAPAYSPDRLGAPAATLQQVRPGGLRPLYTQEVVPAHDPVKQWNGESTFERVGAQKPGGFAYPSSSPTRDGATGARPAQPSSMQAPATRLHTYSSPTRPAANSLQTPPPPLVQRPYSDPYRAHASSSSSSLAKASSPASPASRLTIKQNQCHGTTANGKRCTRTVGGGAKAGSSPSTPQKAKEEDIPRVDLTVQALMQLDRRLSISRGKMQSRNTKGKQRAALAPFAAGAPVDESDEDFDTPAARINATFGESGDAGLEELPMYCFQHAKQTMDQKGIFIGPKYLDFEDWIPPGLPQETKLQLRHEMSKPFSSDDVPGYIYVHEMASKDHQNSLTTFIKLGRSIKPVARLNQWKSQCRSREPIVRDIFPLHASHPLKPGQTVSGLLNQSPSRLHGGLAFAEQGTPNHHRWERLCLIELAGLAAIQAQRRREPDLTRQKCPDCSRIHVELFLVDKGSYERDIVDLVLRWQRFVEL